MAHTVVHVLLVWLFLDGRSSSKPSFVYWECDDMQVCFRSHLLKQNQPIATLQSVDMEDDHEVNL